MPVWEVIISNGVCIWMYTPQHRFKCDYETGKAIYTRNDDSCFEDIRDKLNPDEEILFISYFQED